MKVSNPNPKQFQITSKAYIRNADVIAEVLLRAGGICEKCGMNAPFIRASNLTPYLEVHHIIPLSKGGEGTVKNEIALAIVIEEPISEFSVIIITIKFDIPQIFIHLNLQQYFYSVKIRALLFILKILDQVL